MKRSGSGVHVFEHTEDILNTDLSYVKQTYTLTVMSVRLPIVDTFVLEATSLNPLLLLQALTNFI